MAQQIRDAVYADGGSFYQWLSTTDVGSLKADISQIQTQLRTLGITLQNLERDLGTQISDVNTAWRQSFQTMKEAYDSLTANVTSLSEKLTSLDKQITEDLRAVIAIIDDLKKSIPDVTQVTARLNALDTTVAEVKASIPDTKQISSDITMLIQRANDLTDLIAAIEKITNSWQNYKTSPFVCVSQDFQSNVKGYYVYEIGDNQYAYQPPVTSGVIDASEQMMTTRTIRIENRPNQLAPPPGTFVSIDDIPSDLAEGAVVSEVGHPVEVETWFGSCLAYELRSSRNKRKNQPFNPYGKVLLGNALSSPTTSTIVLPNVGSSIDYTAPIPGLMRTFVDSCQTMRMDVTYILHVPVPLGYSQLLRVYAPEVDDSTKTRGVIWKPGACPTLAFTIGWRLPSILALKATGQYKGEPGLTIRIETLEDNSSDTLSQPINMVIWSYLFNVNCYHWQDGTSEKSDEFYTYSPVTPPPAPPTRTLVIEGAREQMDDNPGTLGDTPTEGVPLTGTPAPEAKPADAIVPASSPSTENASSAGNTKQAAAPEQKWYKLTQISFALATDTGKAKQVSITPYTLRQKGEGLFRPFNRNVWCAPGRVENRLGGLEWRITSNRSPTLAALLEVRTNERDNVHSDAYYHQVGGEPTSLFGMPSALSCDRFPQRNFISPWRKCQVYNETISLTMVGRNFCQDHSTFSVTVFVRPGKMRFNVPIKPRKRPAQLQLTGLGDIGNLCLQLADVQVIDAREQYATGLLPADHIAPEADDSPYGGVMDTIMVPSENFSELEQSQFWLRVGNIDLAPGVVNSIELDLPTLMDVNSAGGETPITEFFNRHSEVMATRTGQYGPVVGSYFLQIRPPANVTCNVEHICVPPEINEAVALSFFGLDSLLSLAGGAISSLGGSLVDGAISTISNLIGGIIPGLGGSSSQEVPAATTQPSSSSDNSATGGIFGDIPITRFIEFIRSVAGNNYTDAESIWPTLLVKLVDLIPTGSNLGATTLPATLYVRVDGMAGSRHTFDRVDAFEVKDKLSTAINLDQTQLSLFMHSLTLSDKPKAQELLLRSFTVMKDRLSSSNFTRFDVTTLPNYALASSEDISAVAEMIAAHALAKERAVERLMAPRNLRSLGEKTFHSRGKLQDTTSPALAGKGVSLSFGLQE